MIVNRNIISIYMINPTVIRENPYEVRDYDSTYSVFLMDGTDLMHSFYSQQP